MTKTEAIEALAKFKRYISGGGVVDRTANQALNMAIKALEQQKCEQDKKDCNNCKYDNKSYLDEPCHTCSYTEGKIPTAWEALEQPKPCGDAVSRKWLIEVVENAPWHSEHDANYALHIVRELAPSVAPQPLRPIEYCREHCKYGHYTDLEEEPCDDAISRQAAIDALAELQGRASTKAELKGISKAWKRIKQLPSAQPDSCEFYDTESHFCAIHRPSAQPETKWIQCSERLPEAQTGVIVSCTDDSGDTKFRYTSSGWVTTDKEYWIVDNEINNFVVAWMPLPEVYREEGEWDETD